MAQDRPIYLSAADTVAVAGPWKPKRELLAAPNPFGPGTTIQFELQAAEHVRLYIADPSGRVVRTLEEGVRGAGAHVVAWDGRNDRGAQAPAGIYLYVLHAGERHEMGKLARVR